MTSKTLSALLVIVASVLRVSAQIYDTNGDFVQTFVGSGFDGYLDGQGLQTMFENPSAIVADSGGNLLVLEAGGSRIRKITPSGGVSTFVGKVNVVGGSQIEMTIDHSNVLWIEGISATGLVRIDAGGSVSNLPLSQIAQPAGVCVDSRNTLYISDTTGHKIWRYTTAGVLDVFAGSGNSGGVDGNGIFTSFEYPSTLAADAADNIYVCDYPFNPRIRRIDQNQTL